MEKGNKETLKDCVYTCTYGFFSFPPPKKKKGKNSEGKRERKGGERLKWSPHPPRSVVLLFSKKINKIMNKGNQTALLVPLVCYYTTTSSTGGPSSAEEL